MVWQKELLTLGEGLEKKIINIYVTKIFRAEQSISSPDMYLLCFFLPLMLIRVCVLLSQH